MKKKLNVLRRTLIWKFGVTVIFLKILIDVNHESFLDRVKEKATKKPKQIVSR